MNKARKKILITGAGGQLGRCLQKAAGTYDFEFLFYDQKILDITKPKSVKTVLHDFDPNWVINTAAYTHVDRAEGEREAAYRINATAVGDLAKACSVQDCGLIHISTDYVFNGSAATPIDELAKPDPKTVYGASKLAGEKMIVQSGLQAYYIVRTSWLYSEFGNNFYKTMLRLGRERDALAVVNDQYGSPTNANDLAEAILTLAAKALPNRNSAVNSNKGALDHQSGIYHYANLGVTNWFDFASIIFSRAGLSIKLESVPSSAYPTKAQRPSYSALDTHKIRNVFDLEIPHWEESLTNIMQI